MKKQNVSCNAKKLDYICIRDGMKNVLFFWFQFL